MIRCQVMVFLRISFAGLFLLLIAKQTQAVSSFQTSPADGLAFVSAGELYVTGFFGSSAAVARYNLQSGDFQIVSTGGSFDTAHLTGIAIGSDSRVYVSEFGNRRGGDQQVVEVDPITGRRRTIISNSPPLSQIADLAVTAAGDILAVRTGGTILRIDPDTADTTTIEITVASSSSIAVGPNDDAYVTACVPDATAVFGCTDVVLELDPANGTSVLSSVGFPDATINPNTQRGIAISATGDIYVLDLDNLGTNTIFSVDPLDGSQSLITADELLTSAGGLAVGPNGNIFVNELTGIVEIDVLTGEQSLILDFPLVIPIPPAIDIEKLTNGNRADGANDSDVPRIAPGDTVTWTYQIRNDDQTAYSETEIIVTDSDPRVTPVLDPTGDDGDLLLSPGETWIYRASAQAQDLSTVQTNLITNGDFERGDFSGWTLFTTSNGTLGGPTVRRRDVNGDGLATLAAQFRVRPITVEPDVFEGGGIFQSVTTDSGLFDISADIAKINDGAGPIVFTLLIDGTPVDTFEFGSTGIGGVDRATLNKTVQLDAGSHEVRILVERQGLGFEQWIDNITLRASVVVSGCNNGRPAYENTARVRISRSTGFSDKDSSHYCNPGATNIDIRKQAEGAETRTFPIGSDVTFGIVVENTGDEDLTSVVVTDVLVPDCDRNIGDLAAGAVAYNCTAPAVSVSFTNEVCVTGKQGGVAVNDCDPSTVEIESTGAQVVPIDIKPGNKRNVINPRSRGGIWVAVLSDDEFDPRQIKVRTVRFGPDEAKATRYYVRDVNRDGLGDLLLRFKIPQTGIACGDKEATLTGETFGGQSITGTDSIKTVGCRKKHH